MKIENEVYQSRLSYQGECAPGVNFLDQVLNYSTNIPPEQYFRFRAKNPVKIVSMSLDMYGLDFGFAFGSCANNGNNVAQYGIDLFTLDGNNILERTTTAQVTNTSGLPDAWNSGDGNHTGVARIMGVTDSSQYRNLEHLNIVTWGCAMHRVWFNALAGSPLPAQPSRFVLGLNIFWKNTIEKEVMPNPEFFNP